MKRDTAHERGYTTTWRKARRLWLLNFPLCRYCSERGRSVRAEVVDHIIPHKGDQNLFWDQTNWQSLCKGCHDGAKQREENKGFSTAVGIDGWPLDPKHPANTGCADSGAKKKLRKNKVRHGGEAKKSDEKAQKTAPTVHKKR